ncbi:TPA: phage DNA ejection protein [Escherichia coli]|nr:phage DNA ejection protein [Escherichia coli]
MGVVKLADYRPQLEVVEHRVADTEDGFMRVANEITDSLLMADLTVRQLKVMLAIMRKTYGFNKPMDRLTNTQIAAMTGIHHTHVCAAKRQLIERKFLIADGVKIGVNKVVSQWISQDSLTLAKTANKTLAKSAMGDLAMRANVALSQGPEAYSKFITDNKDRLNRVGANADWMIQTGIQNPEQLSHMLTTMSLGALGPEKAFDVQDKMAGREIDRGKLAETIRSNQAGEALQARGQNLSYQSAMTGHNIAAQRLALDQQEFGFKMQQAQEKAQQLISEAPKLSVNMEKGIETAVNNATASSNSANSMSALAQQFRAEKPTTGLFGNAQNMFAKLTGSDTTLRDLRIRQNALVNSQVLKFLPPGPATDKDVEIVRQGAPTDMDNPETVARWLDAMANLERRNAQFNEFKAEWMSANGNPGQSRNGGQILGLDVKKGESLGSAVKRYMSMNTDAAPAQDSTPSGEPRNQVGSYTSKSGIQFTVE